jgi:hypothetical protein
VVTLWVPGKDGTPHQRHALIENVRRIRASAEVYAGFDLEIPGIGRFDQCRVWQYRKGGFFAIGESMIDRREHRYVHFVEFVGPFSTWLANAVRAEVVAKLLELDTELRWEDEPLALSENERNEVCAVPWPADDKLIEFDPEPLPGRLVAGEPTVSVTIGEAIRIRSCRLISNDDRDHFQRFRLVLPTSEGLALRPIQLDPYLMHQIAHQYSNLEETKPSRLDRRIDASKSN